MNYNPIDNLKKRSVNNIRTTTLSSAIIVILIASVLVVAVTTTPATAFAYYGEIFGGLAGSTITGQQNNKPRN